MYNSEKLIGKKFVAWDIWGHQVVGTTFITITKVDEKYIYGRYIDKYRGHDIKFSAITGKEFRPMTYYRHLTNQEVTDGKI